MQGLSEIKAYADQIAEIARWAYRNGWAPATSTNYSVRLPPDAAPAICAITSSGVDKLTLQADDVLAVDREGRPADGSGLIPSAETLLHLMIYETRNAGAVLHTHSKAAALLSRFAAVDGRVLLSGWEMLKGLEGVTTHESEVALPVFPNSQDIPALAAYIKPWLGALPSCFAFLLSGHGLYVWGKDLTQAKRHLEACEFLLQCEWEVRRHGNIARPRPAY